VPFAPVPFVSTWGSFHGFKKLFQLEFVHALFQLRVDSLFKFGGGRCLGLSERGDSAADLMRRYDPAGVFRVSLSSDRGSVPAIQLWVPSRTDRVVGLFAWPH